MPMFKHHFLNQKGDANFRHSVSTLIRAVSKENVTSSSEDKYRQTLPKFSCIMQPKVNWWLQYITDDEFFIQ